MKKYLFLLLLLVQQLEAQQTSALFLGNSYTYVNNMPDLFYQLSLAGGDSVFQDSNTPGGYTFQMHSNDANSIAKINSRPWNFVILQGQSQEPSLDTPYVVTNVFPYAYQLNNMVQANDSCTQTIYFMTWGRKNGDASNCAAYPPVCTFLGMQEQLRNRYLQMGTNNNAIVAPVGEAWKNVIATNPAFDLYQADESHPSLYGSYLTACVFYATIFRESPLGLNYYAGLPVNDATLLQSIAGSTVLDSMNLWNTEIYYPDASYIFSQPTSTSLLVSNSDPNATSWSWNTGSGYVPGTANETLNFPSVNTYTVCLAVTNDCRSDTSCQVVSLVTVGIKENNSSAIRTSYSSGIFSIQFPTSGDQFHFIKLYDLAGREIQSMKTNEPNFELIDLNPGAFLLVIDSESEHFTQKIVIPSN